MTPMFIAFIVSFIVCLGLSQLVSLWIAIPVASVMGYWASIVFGGY